MHRARRFYETNSILLWSLVMAIVPEFCFTLISFHHQCHEKNDNRSQIYIQFFFHFFLFYIFIFGDAIFYEPTFFFSSSHSILLVGQSNFVCAFFFVASVLSRFLRQQMTFVSLHTIFSQRFSVVMLSFENPFEHSFKSYCNEFKRFQTEAHTKNCSTPIKWKRKKNSPTADVTTPYHLKLLHQNFINMNKYDDLILQSSFFEKRFISFGMHGLFLAFYRTNTEEIE